MNLMTMITTQKHNGRVRISEKRLACIFFEAYLNIHVEHLPLMPDHGTTGFLRPQKQCPIRLERCKGRQLDLTCQS